MRCRTSACTTTSSSRPRIVVLSLGAELLPRACPYVGGVVRDLKCSLLKIGGAADHFHLLTTMHQSLALADFVKEIKVASSKWIHETFEKQKDFGWQDGYAAFTVSKSIVGDVEKYIASQEEHHRRKTFQEELLALLERHGVAYDEQYIWR